MKSIDWVSGAFHSKCLASYLNSRGRLLSESFDESKKPFYEKTLSEETRDNNKFLSFEDPKISQERLEVNFSKFVENRFGALRSQSSHF